MNVTTRLTALERAKRAEARAIRRHTLELATTYSIPIAQLEEEFARITLITQEGERLYPGDVDRQITYAAEEFGIDATELRAEIDELTQSGLSTRSKRGS